MPFQYRAVTFHSRNLPLELTQVSIGAEQKDGVFSVAENELLVKVKYAALNPVDTIMKSAALLWFSRGQTIFGKDYSGEVVAIGSAAAAQNSLKVGDRIMGVIQGITKNGSVGEYVLVNVLNSDTKVVAKIPEGVSYAEAACLPVVLGTAYSAIEKVLKFNKLKKVLVIGGGTSVGRFAVQLLKNVYGASEIVASCSGSSADTIKAYGATSIIDYTQHKLMLPPVLESVKETGAFDFIFDCCGNDDLFTNLDTILVPKAEGASYTTVAGDRKLDYSSLSFYRLLREGVCLGVRLLKSLFNLLNYRYEFFMLSLDEKIMATILQLVADKKVKVDIDSEYVLEDFQDAVNKQLSNKARGKVLVRMY